MVTIKARGVLALGVPRRGKATFIRDLKDTVYPFFESDTLFLECLLLLVV